MDAIFKAKQRVRMLPNKRFPGKVRYGIILFLTDHPGMYLVNEDRASQAGEWAYCVASYRSPSAGALWWSAAGLEAMKR